MANWDYKPEERSRITAGDYRLEVLSAEEKLSSKGSPMIVVVVRPNKSDVKISHYFVKNEYFNRNITEFFDSFGIERGDFEFLGWVGAVGAGRLKEDEKGYLKVHYFLSPEKAEKLPPWVGEKPERQKVSELGGDFNESIPDEDLPF
jgi:hypothetical protein